MAGWYSILPDHLTFIETLIIRIFLVLGLINLSPWLIAILYDLFYYLYRQIAYEIPVYGGRARGDARPRAPSLRDRNRRRSIAEMLTGDSPARIRQDHQTELRRRQHQRISSNGSISEDKEEHRD